MASALFMPIVNVDVDGEITCDWGSSLVNWTDDTGHVHEDDEDPFLIASALDRRLAEIRDALDNDVYAVAELVRPFFRKEN